MRWIILMLTVWLASACAAQQTSGRAIPMAMFQIPPTETTQQVREVNPSPIQFTESEATPLPIPTLAWQELNGPFMPAVSCYDFSKKVAVGTYDPCAMTGIKPITLGFTPEFSSDTHLRKLCVEPTLMGSTFSPTLRCSTPALGVYSDKYSPMKPSLWYLLLRESAQDAEQKDP